MRRKPDTGQPDQAVEATSEIDRFVRVGEAAKLTARSHKTIQREFQWGKFPLPDAYVGCGQLRHRPVWRLSTLKSFIAGTWKSTRIEPSEEDKKLRKKLRQMELEQWERDFLR